MYTDTALSMPLVRTHAFKEPLLLRMALALSVPRNRSVCFPRSSLSCTLVSHLYHSTLASAEPLYPKHPALFSSQYSRSASRHPCSPLPRRVTLDPPFEVLHLFSQFHLRSCVVLLLCSGDGD
ncbi:hypothetical protein BJV74DRAFT_847508 [Russula compacta]|nr:hypothetical protein BJV74DRAFT_847508 [Russula compacta]